MTKDYRKKVSAGILSTLLVFGGLSTPAQAYVPDNGKKDMHGINITYDEKEFALRGCNEHAWNKLVENYTAQVNDYKKQTARMNQDMLSGITASDQLPFGDCLGSVNDMFEETSNMMNELGNAAKGLAGLFQSGFAGLSDIFSNDSIKGMANVLLEDVGKEMCGKLKKKMDDKMGKLGNQVGKVTNANKQLEDFLNKARDNPFLGGKITGG